MTDIKYFTKSQKMTATVLYISMVISIIMTIGAVIWAISDLIMAEGKMQLFLSLSIGYQIAIIGTILAGLFFLFILFYGLFRRGIGVILNIIFKTTELEDKYKDRMVVKIASGALMLSLFAIIIGIFIAIFYEILLALSGGDIFTFAGVSENLSGGQIALIICILYLIVNGLAFGLIYMWFNGYNLICKMIFKMEEED